jgi:hypothetical protein
MLHTRFPRLLLASLCIVWTVTAVSQRIPVRSSTLPAEVEGVVSAAIGRDLRAYHAQPVNGGSQLENSRHDLAARFDTDGVQIRSGSGHWQMHLLGYGRGKAIPSSSNVAPRAHLNRVEYPRGSMTEWYVSGPRGLEQGFTIRRQPAQAESQPLTVALGISGNVGVPAAREDGVALTSPDGTSVLRYEGLTAYDARGQELRSWLELRDRQLLLKVDDSTARYPVVVDPWIQRANLTASDGQSGDALGSSIAVSADTVVVGAPTSGPSQGAVYVFVKPASGWKNMTQVAKLTASDATFDDELGFVVDIQGDTIVAGAPVVGFNNKPGAVYVFVKPAGGWKDMTQTAELLPSDAQSIDQLGWSVSISGNTVVSGAIGDGKVYIFVKPVRGWKNMTQTAELTTSDGDILGDWVAIDRDTIAAGSSYSVANPNGAAYVYVKPTKSWKNTKKQNAKLVASDGQPLDELGFSVSVEGDIIVAGAPEAMIGSNKEQGAGYVFVKPVGGWKGLLTQTAKLTSSDGEARDQLGWAASISGNTLALGANHAHSKGASTGAAYVYVKPAAGWKNSTQQSKVFARDGRRVGSFGESVSMSGGTLVVGAPRTTVGSNSGQGAAYVFEFAK